jgi:hypothetical protein
MFTKEDYLAFLRVYAPPTVKLAIIAESPPEGKPPKEQTYFYKPDGSVGEPLFSALMKQLNFVAKTKHEGLREFQRRGWILIDATYRPVNGIAKMKERNAIILQDYPVLVASLKEMSPDKSVPVILIKANVWELLGSKLTADGFKVLNAAKSIPFPSHGKQPIFHASFASLVEAMGVK